MSNHIINMLIGLFHDFGQQQSVPTDSARRSDPRVHRDTVAI